MLIFAMLYVQDLASQLSEFDSADLDAIHFRFGSVPDAVLTMYQLAFGMIDAGDIYDLLSPTGAFNGFLLLAYVGFYQIALINILTGIFVDKALQYAKPERESEIMEERQATMDRASRLKELCLELNLSEPGIIRREEFMDGMDEPDIRYAFQAEGLHISDARTFFDLVQTVHDKDYVDTDTFVASCLRLRGVATSIDLQHLELLLKGFVSEFRKERRAVTGDGLHDIWETPQSIKVTKDNAIGHGIGQLGETTESIRVTDDQAKVVAHEDNAAQELETVSGCELHKESDCTGVLPTFQKMGL